MSDLPPFEDCLYYVWGFYGILVLDALSHTEALEFYASHFHCDKTMVEHVMVVPNIEEWAERPPDPEVAHHHLGCDAANCNCNCDECRIECTYFPTAVVDPKDPRISWINLETEKTALDARLDQSIARSRERGGYLHDPDPVDFSSGPQDPVTT